MNKKHIIYTLFFMLIILISSCNLVNDLFTDKEAATIAETDKVLLTINDTGMYSSANQGRTVSVDVPIISGYNLYGSLAGEEQELLSSFTTLTDAKVNLGQGTWDFTLSALNVNGDEILSAINSNVILDDNPVSLNFDLMPLSSGTGTISVNLSWSSLSEASVNSIETTFNGEIITPALTITSNSINFLRENVDKGNYTLGFKLLNSDGLLISSVLEIVQVLPNFNSSKNIYLAGSELNSPPNPPSISTVVSVPNIIDDNGTKIVSWVDNSFTETGFEIYLHDGLTKLGEVSAGITTFTDTSAIRGEIRIYKIRSINDFGSSSWSNSIGLYVHNLISFDTIGGSTIAGIEASNFTYIPEDIPTLQDKIFYGWYESSDYSGSVLPKLYNIDSEDGNITLYAKWKDSDPFTTVWKTDNVGYSESEQISLPLNFSGESSFYVDWGDGTSDLITSKDDTDKTHTYENPGTYTIKMDGLGNGFNFSLSYNETSADYNKLLEVVNWGNFDSGKNGFSFSLCQNLTISATDIPDLSEVLSLNGSFQYCSSLDSIPNINSWDTSNVTDMSLMFRSSDTFNCDLSLWDTTSITDMSYMFYDADAFNGDLSSWNTSSVADMNSMFAKAYAFNGVISAWDTSSVTNMGDMFRDTTIFNGDLSSWDTSSVTDMNSMFNDANAFNGDIYSWDTSSVTDMGRMFWDTTIFNGDLSYWDTSSVTDMGFMFDNAVAFNGDISTWDTSNVTSMYSMFYGAVTFNGDISSWNTSSVKNMDKMFYNATSFNGNVSSWDISSVTNMWQMFRSASAFNGDLSSWDTSSVTDMHGMFMETSLFNGNISTWNTSNVTRMDGMFSSATVFNGDISSWDTSSVFNMISMFSNAEVFNQDLSSWDTSSVTHMRRMFYYADIFNGDISSWDTSSVKDMSYMFYRAYDFTGNLSSWDTSSVTNMSYMFNCAFDFNGDLSTWDTVSVTDMNHMFYGADAFNGDLSLWDTSSVTDMSYMFYIVYDFTGNLSSWDTSSVTNMEYMFYDANAFNGDLSLWDTSGVTDINHMFYSANAFNGDLSLWDTSSVTNMSEIFIYSPLEGNEPTWFTL